MERLKDEECDHGDRSGVFFDAALLKFTETANNVVFFAYKKHLTCIVSYLFVWYHSFIIFIEGIFAEETDGKKTDM